MQHKKDLEIKPSWTTVGLSIVLGDGRKDESSGVTDVVGSQPGASTVSWGTWQGCWCRKATPPVTLHDTFNTLNTSNTSGEGASCISLASRDNSNTTSRMFYVGGSTEMNGNRKSYHICQGGGCQPKTDCQKGEIFGNIWSVGMVEREEAVMSRLSFSRSSRSAPARETPRAATTRLL